MSSSEKSNVANLEGKNDFGDPELNKVFEELDEKTKGEILANPIKENQISILKNIIDPELKAFYNSLSEKKRANLDKHNIRDKFIIMKAMINKQKKEGINVKVIEPEPEKEQLSTKSKIGIIVPFRDTDPNKARTKQLNSLVSYMKTYLEGERL